MEPQVEAKLTSLRRRVEQSPDDEAAWGELAMNLDVHDLKQESIPCYRRARELDPNDFRWLYYGALALEEVGSPEALAWLEAAMDLDPGYPPLLIRYGRALLDAGRPAEALEAFRRGAGGPLTSHALLGMAEAGLAQGDLETSRAYLLEAARIRPDHAEVHALLAEVERRLGRSQGPGGALPGPQKAEATPLPDPLLTRWADEGVSSFWHQSRGRDHLAAGRYAEAAAEFREALASHPTPRDHNNLGVALEKQGQYEGAIAQFRAALSLDPDYAEALNNLGSALAEAGRIVEAVPYVEAALRLDPALADAHLNLGTLLRLEGRGPAAVAAFRRGLEEASGDTTPLALRLAWMLATWPERGLRNGDEALRLAEEACRRTAFRLPEALDALAAAHAERGDFHRAVQAAEQAAALARSAGKGRLAQTIEQRLAGYAKAEPFREALVATPAADRY